MAEDPDRVRVRTKRLGGDTTNRIDFWVDQLNQLRRARNSALPGDAIIAELDKQIELTAKQIEDLGGDVSALTKESVGANFVEPTNVTAEEVKPKATETPRTESRTKTTAQLRSGEIARTGGVDLPQPDLGRRNVRASGGRSLGVGDVGDLAGTLNEEIEGTVDNAIGRGALRTGAKALGVMALPIGIMSELEGSPLGDPNEPAFLAVARAVAELPAFKTATVDERQQMLNAAYQSARDMLANVAAERLAQAQAPRTGDQQRGGLRGAQAAKPYVAGGEVPPEIQAEADRQVPPQQPQTTSAAPANPQQDQAAQTPQGVAAQVGLNPGGQDPNAPTPTAPQGVAAPPQGEHYQTNASGDGKIYEDEWPRTPGQRPQPPAAQGVAAPPQQQTQAQPGGSSATNDSRNMTQDEWGDLLGRMKNKGIKGFNFAGYAFEADNEMPSGYRVIYDRGVAKNRPEGTERKDTKR